MNEIMMFTDGSVNTGSKTGFGAVLIIDDINISIEDAKCLVSTCRFDNTSSTKLELQTFLWAIQQIPENADKILLYTDSQNIVGLSERRIKLEGSDYKTRTGKNIGNHDLYREFYKVIDKLNCEIIKIEGHKKTSQKDHLDLLFTLVDRASRRELRAYSETQQE